MIKRNCLQCGKEFETYMCYIKRGGGKFCCASCSTTYRNLYDNPSKREDVKKKISENHADVSGDKNPMYGRTGENAPSYIDGRNSFSGEIYRRILKANGVKEECSICGGTENLQAHHKDGDHSNNSLENLEYLCVKCHLTIAHRYIRDEKGRFIGSQLSNINEMEVVL